MSDKEKNDKNGDDKNTKVAIIDKSNKASTFVSIERSILDIDILNDPDKALELMKIMSKGALSKGKSAEALLAMYLKSRELGIGFASAADHMQVINNKTGVDIHIIKALLLKAGSSIWWEKLKDYEPRYKYTDGSNVWIKFGKADPDEFLPVECMYVYDKETKNKCEADGKIAVWKDDIAPFDWITTYKFEREILLPYTKNVKILIEVSSFSWREAIVAKLPLDKTNQFNPDSNWQKYRKLMLDHRAFTFGARAIGSDLLMGVYETKELLDMNKISYTIDAEGQVIQ